MLLAVTTLLYYCIPPTCSFSINQDDWIDLDFLWISFSLERILFAAIFKAYSTTVFNLSWHRPTPCVPSLHTRVQYSNYV